MGRIGGVSDISGVRNAAVSLWTLLQPARENAQSMIMTRCLCDILKNIALTSCIAPFLFFDDLHNALSAIHTDTVTGFENHCSVEAAHHSRDAQFTGDDGSM